MNAGQDLPDAVPTRVTFESIPWGQSPGKRSLLVLGMWTSAFVRVRSKEKEGAPRGSVGSGASQEPGPLVICFVNGAKGGGGRTYLEFLDLGGLLPRDFQDVGNGR